MLVYKNRNIPVQLFYFHSLSYGIAKSTDVSTYKHLMRNALKSCDTVKYFNEYKIRLVHYETLTPVV